MNKNLECIMKEAASVFKRGLKSTDKANQDSVRILRDNYHILERCTSHAIDETGHLKGHFKDPAKLPDLFQKCRELCRNGILPDKKDIITFFEKNGGLDGTELRLLPLLITCSLISFSADGVKAGSHTGCRILENSIASLHRLSETDFESITEKLFAAEKYLIRDKEYVSMDEYSKSVYRRRLSLISTKENKSEEEFVKEAVEKSEKSGRHIGEYLFPAKKSRKNGYLFLAMEIVMPLAVAFCFSVFFKRLSVGLLSFIPLWELLRYPIEKASLQAVRPRKLLRLSTDCDAVKNAYALITVSVLVPDTSGIKELENHLEELYLSNCTGNIKICCLADLKEAGMSRKPEDKVLIKAAKEMTDRLNSRYSGGFILAVRPRVHSVTQNGFIPRERKRGAITELVRAIKGNRKGFSVLHGDTGELEKVKYLAVLDSDTQPVFDSVRELIAVAEHPLNRPVIKNGRVISGYGIIAPKTETALKSKNRTVFGRLTAGDSGISAYDNFSSERYRDLFGKGIFCGKGLIDVDCFASVLDKALPNERILSHDILEGGYLRTGFVSDIVITEDIPQSVISYYRRLHRWVRGDWQNIRFIFGRNPLDFISRYMMFDNLRRSVTPFVSALAVGVSMFTDNYVSVCITLCAMAAFCARYLYSALSSLTDTGIFSLTGLYFSKTLPPALYFFIRSFVALAFSAREALVCADAIFRALWRMIFSKRKLLEWSTAAQSEKIDGTNSIIVSCIPSMLAAFFLLVFGMSLHRLLGLIILADVPLALVASVKSDFNAHKITDTQKETIISYSSAMWSYFENLCGRENNFLPPDNIQFSPVKATAYRTSPTNIGLMLASFLSARDLGFISSDELYMRMNLSLGSVEKLEKYKGNLFNWYNIRTAEVVNPRFISTVDSGNFLCCLTAVKEGLREYATECPPLNGIIERIEKIISETELTPLFNEHRKLFYIGINPDNGEKSKGCYDLYMSEARMTDYFAIARGDVSKKHWGALGRIHIRSGRYTGLASWSGTAFEYFMPNLFIPAPYGSLSSEALSFCFYCQRKKAGKMPFGISESGFYSFDRELNYQYKAHGIEKLALSGKKRDGTVVSPYSTFLMLPHSPDAALKNLKKLEKLGMFGIYGFYEALDYTKGRGIREPSVVCSFMSHHIGMSLVSANNFINGGIMQKRFMNDKHMKRASTLLDEKISTESRVFKNIVTEEKINIRERIHGNLEISNNPDPFVPEAMILSNGRMTTCITDCGTGVTLFDGLDVTVNSVDNFLYPQGVFGVFAGKEGYIPFVRALDLGTSAEYSAIFDKDGSVHTARKGNTLLKMKTTLLQKQNCELRSFTVENKSRKESLSGELVIFFEPCIEKRKAYASHRMFSKLFLTDEKDEENRCILFSRRGDGENESGIAAGIIENIASEQKTSRECVLRSPEGVFSLGKIKAADRLTGTPDCCGAFTVKIDLKSGEKQTVTLGIAVAENKEQALNTLLSVRAGRFLKKLAKNPFYADTAENRLASRLLPSILFSPLSRGVLKSNQKCIYTRNDLWSLGISGENPIIGVEASCEEDAEGVIPYIKINKKLRNCGVRSDLAVIFNGEENYLLPITNAIKNAAEKEDCGLMIGVTGGIHTVDKTLHSYRAITALENSAVFYDKSRICSVNEEKNHFRQLKYVCEKRGGSKDKSNSTVKAYNFTDGKITIEKSSETLDVPWFHILSNQSLGTLVSDKALGFTWALNSRENKLTPWSNDLMSDNRGELLIMKYNGVLYDLVAIGDAEFTPEYALWSAKISGVDFKIKVTVPKRGMTKKCTAEISNCSDLIRNFDLIYFVDPVLGTDKESRGSIHASRNEYGAVFENPFAEIHGFSSLICPAGADYVCFSKKNFFEGDFTFSEKTVFNDCCVSVGKNIVLKKGEKISVDFFLSWGATEKAALMMPEVSDFSEKRLNPVKLKSKNESLNLFFNSFLYSQIKQTRFWGRTGFSQCSGAYGFRDQLQDCLAFIDFEPRLTLTHIARCASVQFEEGDVLHWWHIITNKGQQIKGIRTRCSDDMLWLPYVCIKYYQKTGNSDFFDITVPYLKGEKLAENENERYLTPERTDYKESLLKHCIKAVDRSLNFGKNGFPLVGSCDWNDAFSKIGEKNAESVWLAMFQIIVLEGISEICAEKGYEEKSRQYTEIAARLRDLTEEKAWCGDRYARFILENGEIFGKYNDFTDILPQAFAVFAGLGKNGRDNITLDTVLQKLFDGKKLKLLSPSFEEDVIKETGYIAAYPSGIRENGGQYTHAAVWFAWALYMKGRTKEAEDIINSLNPLSFYSDEKSAGIYKAEPYVLAGDICCADSEDGRAGWTHFTGSAAWYYRCIYENSDEKECLKADDSVKE